MYSIGQYVVCKNKGVCVVEDITTLSMPGVDKTKEYYILKPHYENASTVYVPVESKEASLRPVLTEEDAQELIASLPELEPIALHNEKMVEQAYKACMKVGEALEWAKLLKTICERNKMRMEAGRKETAIDARYYKLAQDNLYGELAVALGMEKNAVGDYIAGKLEIVS